MAPLRVVLADDHSVFCDGVAASLGEGFAVVGRAETAGEAITVITATRPDVVTCDLCMPGGGLAVVEACAGLAPIVLLTVSEQEQDVLEAVAAGAVGYITKSVSGPELRAALAQAATGEPVFSPTLAGLVLAELRRMAAVAARRADQPARALTETEQQMVSLLARGASDREVGRALGIGHSTVGRRVGVILDKLSLARREDLLAGPLSGSLLGGVRLKIGPFPDRQTPP